MLTSILKKETKLEKISFAQIQMILTHSIEVDSVSTLRTLSPSQTNSDLGPSISALGRRATPDIGLLVHYRMQTTRERER